MQTFGQSPTRVTDVADRDIVWGLQVYNCVAQATWCLNRLRRQYPGSRIVVISDGDDQSYEALRGWSGVEFIDGTHLHTLETCHLYVARMLRALVSGPESYCFKIDPDTCVWRRLLNLPHSPSMFGTLETLSEWRRSPIRSPPNVQGGCIGMTRTAAEAIVNSSVLTYDLCVARALETWARCTDMVQTVAQNRFCDDFVLSWAAGAVNIPIVASPEINSRWRWPVDNSRLTYAVTHPHKLPV
jgi:hypothetical protein